jgi:hypothetical protein
MDSTKIRAMASDFDVWWKKNRESCNNDMGISKLEAKGIFFAGFEACDSRVEVYSSIEPEHKIFKKSDKD